jgi:hypothetical protein
MINLLVSEGHVSAGEYPLGYAFDESEITRERLNGAMASEAVLFQSAVSSLLSKTAAKEFNKRLRELTGG